MDIRGTGKMLMAQPSILLNNNKYLCGPYLSIDTVLKPLNVDFLTFLTLIQALQVLNVLFYIVSLYA